MNRMLFVVAGLIAALAAACAGSTPVPTVTTVPPAPTVTAVPLVPTATAGPRLSTQFSTPTLKVVQEWKLQDISVDGNQVTVALRVYAGIDVGVTVGGLPTAA